MSCEFKWEDLFHFMCQSVCDMDSKALGFPINHHCIEREGAGLTLKVLNSWKFTSDCSLKPLWSGMGEVVPARTSPTLHPPFPPTVHQLS